MIRMCSGVYPVTGKAGACLYDLTHRKLWHIGKEYADLLKVCAEGVKTVLSDAERHALEQLAENGLICFGEAAGLPDIAELRRKTAVKQAWITVCDACNLRCIHCYHDSAPERRAFMALADYRHACRELLAAGIRRVQLIGGEPLCHPDIETMLTEAAGQFEWTEIFTNGTLLTWEICKLLAKCGVYAAVSVYSYLPEMHDRVTGRKGSHAQTLHGIEMLRAAGVPVRTAAVHMKGIETGERNTDLYTISPVHDMIRMSGRANAHLLTPELLRRKQITKDRFRAPLDPERVADAVSGNPCFAKKICIETDLRVYPCIMERRLTHGSLRDHPLTELLKPEITGLSKDKIAGCCDCEYRYACPQCLPDALTDNPYAKPYYCTYDEQNGRWAVMKQI